MKDELDNRQNQPIPSNFIITLLKLILYNNIFEFHESYWKQDIGAAMGSKPVPHNANTFMAQIDKKILALAEQGDPGAIALLLRFFR